MAKKRHFNCDGCGNDVFDTPHPDYNENYIRQAGIQLCTPCKYDVDSLEEE